MRKRRKYQEGGESRYVQPKNILNPKAPKQYPVYKQPRDPNAFYRNASPGSINEDYTIESFLLPSPALKGAGQLYKGTKAGFKRLAKEGLEDEAKLASEYAAKVQSRANIAAKRDGRLLNKQRVLGQADFEDLTNDARHLYSEHGIELPPAEFDAIKHLNPHVNKAAARQALKAADAGDDVFGSLHGKATLRDARRAGLSDDEINQMRAGRLKPYTNPARPIVGFYGANRHGGRVSYRTGSRLIPNPGFDTGVQVSDATRTRIPKNAQAALASEEYNKDLTGRSGLSEEGFRAKYNKSRARARNMPSSFDVISNQLWEGAKEPFKFIGADPDLIRTNPAEGIPQALAGTLMLELPVGEMFQAGRQVVGRFKKAPPTSGKAFGKEAIAAGRELGEYLTTQTPLRNAYKLNPWAERLNNANKSYRVAGMDALEDFQNTGVLRSQRALPENPTFLDKVKARPTSFPSFQKGYADLNYLPDEGGVIFETGLPTFKRGEINPVTGLPIKGRHYAHRVIDPETGKIMTEIPGSNINVYGSKPHWLKGYKQIDVPQPSFKSEIDWSKWNKEIPENKSLMEEYYTIEQTSKANGTWMKNPDGSAFQGTPEQFIQQNSQNFKKAFPNGALTTFRGGSSNNVMRGNLASDNPNIGSIFTGNKTSIHRYGDRNRIITPEENSIDNGEPGMMELLYNKKNNVLEFDAKNSNWDNIKKELLPDNHKTIKAITQTSRENPLITTTDDIARHLQDKDIDYATINNIIDGTPFSRETIFNHKPGNYLKSRWYNNGMFDMTNPNIYKAVVPTIMGATALKTRQQKKEGGEIEPTRQESRVKEYGFGGKLFKSIGDGLQNSGAFLADNALSIVGATEAANNLYTDSRFGKAAQNVSKITNQINKVAGTIGATALGGPAAGMAMGQVQNMTGNINRKPNQEYNDWDVAGQYAGSLSSMAGMFYNPAGATSSVNPKAKYGGPIRRKIAKQGGTIRPTQGGMFINEGFGIEHALGNLHEDGGIVYNDRTEVENNEKILDGNYVLTDQPYSEPYMKESISRRFDKNSKAISDRNNPDITESAMSFLKDEAIAKNEEYLESLDNMTGKYKKGGLINRRRALDFMYRKMHKQGGVLSNLGTQEGRVVTNRFVDGGLTETDLLNQEEARKMAALKQSILNQNSLPTSQRQYYIDPIQEAYDPTWMGDVYNTARNHDIAVQRANDISNDPNYAGYGQGSKGIPYRYPSPKPQTQKQFPWEDTLYGVASLAPAIYNMGAGLFGKTQQYNPENYITRGRLSYKPISGEEVKRQINNQRAATDYQLRDAGITSRRSRLSNSYNTMQNLAQAQEIIDNINTQGQLETDKYNIGLDQDNNRIRLTVADINDRNRAARQNMLAQGFSDISEFAQGTRRDKIMKSMLTKMYGRRGGRIAW